MTKEALQHQLTLTRESHEAILAEHDTMVDEYHSLSKAHESLHDSHQQLISEFDVAAESYTNKVSDHYKLSADHEALQQQHQALLETHAQQQQQHQDQLQVTISAQKYTMACLESAIDHKTELGSQIEAEFRVHGETQGHRDELSHQLSLKTQAHEYTMALLDSTRVENQALALQLQHSKEAQEYSEACLDSVTKQASDSAHEIRQRAEAHDYTMSCLDGANVYIHNLNAELQLMSEALDYTKTCLAGANHQVHLLHCDTSSLVLNLCPSDLRFIHTNCNAQVQEQAAQLEHEREAHKQTMCSLERHEAQLQEVYWQQTRAQGAEADANTENEANLLYSDSLAHDLEDMQLKHDALRLKPCEQKQQIEDQREFATSHASLLAENCRLAEDVEQLQDKAAELQGCLAYTETQLTAVLQEHTAENQAFKNRHDVLVVEVHSLQDEVLRLEAEIGSAQQQLSLAKQHLEEQRAQGFRTQSGMAAQLNMLYSEKLELKDSLAQTQRNHQLEVLCLEDEVQSSKQAKQQLQQQLHETLQQQQQQADQSTIQTGLQAQLTQFDSQHSELKAELGSLRAHLRTLHELAVSGQITPDAVFDMFAVPVPTAVAKCAAPGDAAGVATASIPQQRVAATADSLAATACATSTTSSTPFTIPTAMAVGPVSVPVATASSSVTTAVPQTDSFSAAQVTESEASVAQPLHEVHVSLDILDGKHMGVLDSKDDFASDPTCRAEELEGDIRPYSPKPHPLCRARVDHL